MQAPEEQHEEESRQAPMSGSGATAQTRSGSKRPASFYVAAALAVLVLLALLGFLWFATHDAGPARDPNAALGQLEGKTQEEIQAELDRTVAEGMLTISIASFVEFPDGQSEGELKIENAPGNHYLMKVTITRDDTGETVYESGIIEPNRHIQKAKLAVDLDAGEYPCTAVFDAYDSETEEPVGQAAAKLTIAVDA